ncbi:PP2C family serine/threonine-protein phosphatase [Sphingomonas sp. M1-B02]|uniref:PP2C family serine/threonine-protein phosphatase n=1 Tax=Sphingomonas sp. M1-B02 TaxID=3114300 RepID=UPI00223EEF6E|nr:PP2C family serine/threonine-protein phosphatase [Sphingomonas sp. S6-11]UZK67839.1 protein phosphatase 2C domain-containing protein [Sphingomonas sp. S6-11]
MSRWIIGGASARGSAHIRTGKPNQDAVSWGQSPDGTRLVGAVSDGHGAAAHFRSEIGSEIAVRCAVSLLLHHLDDRWIDDSDSAIAEEILALWRQDVSAHLAANPYDEAEALMPQPTPLSPYGATLAAFAASHAMIFTLHIGDGDLLLGYADGRLERPLRPDAGLRGEETYSLCLPDAVERFRVAARWRQSGEALPDFLFAASDGVSKSFRDDASFVAAIAAMRVRAERDWDALMAALPDWLAEISAGGSGDDCTVCIAISAEVHAPADSDRGN